ncbi:MAG: S46 family peptidase [Bacteroidia bacterium]
MNKVLLRLLLVIQFSIFNFQFSFADEGMWLPFLLKQLNEDAMIKKGLKIPVEKIYSVNQSSLKDAVVLFGGGCTGEIISDKGLLLTNHHCGFSTVQSLSTVDKDYITNGYWAMQSGDELPCPGLTVTFIIRIDDVSDEINKQLNASMKESEREAKIKEVSAPLEKKAIEGTHYEAKVRPFFSGNNFYLFVTETFKDIRLVGIPPNAIGNFGGDTDNWMWPRHTGDFSLFRIYAGSDNKPAAYSKENIPFKPRYHFTISLKGVQQNDFTMVYGFPGRTQEYLSSHAIDMIERVSDPARVKIRDARLKIMEDGMKISDTVRLKYSAKQKGLSNAYKKWKGELRGLKRLQTVEKKKQFEENFSQWAVQNKKPQHLTLLSDLEKTYAAFSKYSQVNDYFNEAVMGIELLSLASGYQKLVEICHKEPVDNTVLLSEIEKLKKGNAGFFKNYDARVDQKVFAALLNLYHDDVEASFHPPVFETIKNKYNNNFEKYAGDVFAKSIFASQSRLDEVLSSNSEKRIKKIAKDPAFILMKSFIDNQKEKVAGKFSELNDKINMLNRLYLAAQMEMQTDKKFYPDANLTLRVAYGQVMSYAPRDAVKYNFSTTLEGVIEKENAGDEEFIVPPKLKQLYEQKDYGQYGKNNTMPLAFIASNHTTGGNSGSPVINAYGELIGTNYDRVWEGTMSDLQFDPDQCRNITLDIRYTLFIIEKFAGCKRLIDEMNFTK